MTSDQLTGLYTLTLHVPESGSLPIEALENKTALKMGVVSREGVSNLGDEWNRPGAYLLLDRASSDGSWGAYVGKASLPGVKSRLKSHVKNKEHWYRAILIVRDKEQGFNSAEAGWLEGRLYDELYAANDVRLHNGNRPSDETLPTWQQVDLEVLVPPVLRLLRLLGHDPATADDQEDSDELGGSAGAKPANRFKGVALDGLLKAGLVHVGTPLVSTNSVWPAVASVGRGGVVVYNDQVFESPSGAAKAVTGGAANGWAFWAVDDGTRPVTLGVLRARYIELQTPTDSVS